VPLTTDRWPGSGPTPHFVRVAMPPSPRGRVLVLHGYSEHGGRYEHVLHALEAAGFAAVVPDHRGHGRTGPTLGLTADPATMLADLRCIHRRLAQRVPDVPDLLIGASMGGLLALRLLQRQPSTWKAAVLQAPAVAVPEDIPMALVTFVRGIARVAPHMPVRPFFRPERATRDPRFQAWMRTDPYTYRGWVRAATGAHTYRLIRWVRRDLHQVTTPLLLTVGSDDRRVAPAVVADVAAQVTGPAQVEVFDGLRHEAHQEPERGEVVSTWVRWLAAQTGGEGAVDAG